MKLTRFYAAPVCTPSRAQMLTGCYAKRVSLPEVIFPACPIGISAKEHTIAELLKQQGYATMAIGKWHLGDQPAFLPTRHGFDHYLGLPYSNDMGGDRTEPRCPKASASPPLPLVRDSKVIETSAGATRTRLTAALHRGGGEVHRDQQGQPFFLYLPHTAVHVPLHPGQQFRGKSANGTYGDWVEEADASAGRVLDTLRELKLSDHTLVLFTSDNGPWLIRAKTAASPVRCAAARAAPSKAACASRPSPGGPARSPPAPSATPSLAKSIVLPTFVKLAGGTVPDRSARSTARTSAPLLSGQTKDSPHDAQYYFHGTNLRSRALRPVETGHRAARDTAKPKAPRKP